MVSALTYAATECFRAPTAVGFGGDYIDNIKILQPPLNRKACVQEREREREREREKKRNRETVTERRVRLWACARYSTFVGTCARYGMVPASFK